MGDGFGDLDDVVGKNGEVQDPDETEVEPEPEPTDTEPTTSSDSSNAESQTQEDSQSAADTTDASSQPTEIVAGDAEMTADPNLVADLATRPVPGTATDSNYPFAFRRDTWNDERGSNLKFVQRPETKKREDEVLEEVTEELYPNVDINITDVREAVYIAGLMNLDDAVDVLNQWGFADLEELRD
ncbi:hypothetical protein LPA44_13790 [Halobacterium sp. KA-4]|uniref:hypothetical protein n=1 Tax=Halobacterium sp. KA-4 TaxID=2896367 RepID=UPI001E59AB5F|nr:hypothetical protein [Halobacterium sp. KA-4]MCD2200957.1 hypothetical protein [Halobacterium sp. KA-4]